MKKPALAFVAMVLTSVGLLAVQDQALAGASSWAPTALACALTLTALREDLGLKLDSERGQVEVVVIDSAEIPEPN